MTLRILTLTTCVLSVGGLTAAAVCPSVAQDASPRSAASAGNSTAPSEKTGAIGRTDVVRPVGETSVPVKTIGPNGSTEEVRYYEKEGVTYRETRRVMRRPTWETRWEEQEQTVMREKRTTETRDAERTLYRPVTEYQWQPVLRGRWNPFIEPYYEYELMPVTRWESRVEKIRQPVTNRELVPEKRVVRVPVTTMRMVDDEIISRVAVGTRPGESSAANTARRDTAGGKRLDGDPPRKGTAVDTPGETSRK